MAISVTIIESGIKCPYCKRKLFEAGHSLIGDMVIKCPRCKAVVSLDFTQKISSANKSQTNT